MATKLKNNLLILTLFLAIMGCVLLIGHSFKTLILLNASSENISIENYFETSNFQTDLRQYLEENVYKRSLKDPIIQFNRTENSENIKVSVTEHKATMAINKLKYDNIVLKTSFFQNEENKWNQVHAQVLQGLILLTASLIVLAILLVIISISEKPRDGILASGYDAIFSEIHLILVGLPFYLWILFWDNNFYLYKLDQPKTYINFAYYGLIVLFTFVVGQSYLSIIRNVKKEHFFKNFLFFRIING